MCLMRQKNVTGEAFGSSLNLTGSRVENGEETTDEKQEHCCTIVSGNKVRVCYHLSRLMGKPTIFIGENKDADQHRGDREADQRLCFATWIVQFLFYLNPKFQASSSFLCLYRLVFVGPVRKPHCWFSNEAAHLCKRHAIDN